MNITSAQYTKNEEMVKATIDGVQVSVPKDPNNRHYAEILKQVEEGKLKIKDADDKE